MNEIEIKGNIEIEPIEMHGEIDFPGIITEIDWSMITGNIQEQKELYAMLSSKFDDENMPALTNMELEILLK